MRPGIALRPDYDAAQLWALAKATRDAGQSRRLLALAEIYDGGSRTKAARIGGVGLQTLRDWVVRFNARGPDGLINGKAPGNTCKLNDSQRQALVNIVERGPMPAIHGVVRWRLKDLTLWVWEEFRISISETTLSRALRALGYRKLSARPRHHAQNPEALELFKKVSPPPWRRSGRASRRGLRSNCGGRTRPVSARRTRSRAAGPDGAPAPGPRTIRGRARSTSSEQSARNRARAQPWSCRDAIRRP
jgi:transposase